jgi:hypothetical protein
LKCLLDRLQRQDHFLARRRAGRDGDAGGRGVGGVQVSAARNLVAYPHDLVFNRFDRRFDLGRRRRLMLEVPARNVIPAGGELGTARRHLLGDGRAFCGGRDLEPRRDVARDDADNKQQRANENRGVPELHRSS